MSEESKVVIEVHRDKYVASRTSAGKTSLNSGDAVALMLAGLSLSEVYSVADVALDIKAKELTAMYEHLNDGMQRMTLGNRIRGAVAKALKNDEDIMPDLQAMCDEFKPDEEEAPEEEAA